MPKLTPKQLGLVGNVMIKDSSPLASDRGDPLISPRVVKAVRRAMHKLGLTNIPKGAAEIIAAAALGARN